MKKTETAEKKSDGGFLAARLDTLSGVGEKRSLLLEKLGLRTVSDLIEFFPRKYEDRRSFTAVSALQEGTKAVIFAYVSSIERHRIPGKKLDMVTAVLQDSSAEIRAFWFNRKGLEYLLREGDTAVFCGEIVSYGSRLQLSNPEFEVTKNPKKSVLTGIIPIYPSTEGLKAHWFKKLMSEVLEKALPLTEEIIPEKFAKKRSLMPRANAVMQLHRPLDEAGWREARRRFAYEELFIVQAGLALRRHALKSCRPAAKIIPGKIYEAFSASLPFSLTGSQQQALKEIFADTSSEEPMSRLLQGDVGSGKTLVAVGLAAACCDSGVQCAVMAPTEILAAQLYAEMEKRLSPLGVKTAFVKGGQRLSERNAIIKGAENGGINVIVGTQALLFDRVKFKNLGVVVIDEQQRFGVEQRKALVRQGKAPHLLMMSATPIPRSLTMTLFADLDISLLTDRPEGRKKIETRVTDLKQMAVLLQFLIDEAAKGGRVYWVCPRVEESEASAAASAKKRFAFLKKHLGRLGVGLVYGGMSGDEKEEELKKFRGGETKILAGTTVVEVGIDVPEASVMVVEGAERFGLSQLHQLRGRTGRGGRRGVCILLVENLENGIPDRLQTMLDTDDGFKIAEADLELRGSGEISGFAQHGLTEFKFADLKKDLTLIRETREDAAELAESGEIEKYPSLLEAVEKRFLQNG